MKFQLCNNYDTKYFVEVLNNINNFLYQYIFKWIRLKNTTKLIRFSNSCYSLKSSIDIANMLDDITLNSKQFNLNGQFNSNILIELLDFIAFLIQNVSLKLVVDLIKVEITFN